MKGTDTMDTKNDALNAHAKAVQNGNRAAFAHIYSALSGECGRLGRRYATPGTEPEDVAQEAAAALWLAVESWDPSRGAPFEAYARLRMGWAAKNACRKDKRFSDRTVWRDSSTPESFDVDGTLLPLELAADKVLAAIGDETDAAIVQGYLDGGDGETIGSALGISRQAVNLRVKAIRERVKK